jgi:MFS family permease
MMSDTTRRVLAWLPMAGVAALALRVVAVWDQLPAVVMSHFDAQGNPNGYMPRTAFVMMSFATLIIPVVVFGIMVDRIGRRKRSAGWGMVAFSWVINAVLIAVFWGVIMANLAHAPLHVVPVWLLVVAIVPITLAMCIDWRWWLSRSRREAVRQIGKVHIVAEERHGSKTVAGLLAVMAASFASVIAVIHVPPEGRFLYAIFGLVAVVLSVSAVWAWRGFVYRFTTGSVEVRALWFRLRHIPLSEIKDYRAETVNPLTDFGGWGVKGFGSDTAYIWGGHKALHIRTNHGDVYLGHNDPDRLVRDLDAIMKPAHQA